jgi:hypothetical protein
MVDKEVGYAECGKYYDYLHADSFPANFFVHFEEKPSYSSHLFLGSV